MTLTTWLLRPAADSALWDDPWDKNHGWVVVAATEARARELAATYGLAQHYGSGDEGRDTWMDAALTTCAPIDAEQEGVILRDFHAG